MVLLLATDNEQFRIETLVIDTVWLNVHEQRLELTFMIRNRNAPNYEIITESRFSCEGVFHPKSVLFHANMRRLRNFAQRATAHGNQAAHDWLIYWRYTVPYTPC